MSVNNKATEKFEEGLTDFVSHHYRRSIDLFMNRVPGVRFFYSKSKSWSFSRIYFGTRH
jgi:hypothetical protein